jgi:hypothetical protein
VTAERTKLSVGQLGVSAFDVAAVPKAHELDFGVDAGRCADRCDAVPEVIKLPGQVHLAKAIGAVASDDKRAEA